MNPAPILRSARLLLREFGPGDRDDLIALHREPRVREWLMDDYPLDQPEVAQMFIERIAGFYRRHEGLGIWHASRIVGGAAQPIGWFSLMPVEAPVEGPAIVAELGARLRPEAWGGSLSLEGGAGLLAHGFERLGLPRILAFCHPSQRSARAVLAALGFEPQGLQAYCGHQACAFAIDARRHAEVSPRPLRERQREALRAVQAERRGPVPASRPATAAPQDLSTPTSTGVSTPAEAAVAAPIRIPLETPA